MGSEKIVRLIEELGGVKLELMKRMIDDFKVQAVVDLTWQACHTYNIEPGAVQKMVKGIGLPYMHLETDYSSL